MLKRFSRIRSEFGTVAMLRTLLLLVGSIGMAVFGYFGFDKLIPAVIVTVGFVFGWLLRRRTVEHFASLSWALPAALVVYGVVMFVGEKVLGMSRELQLTAITLVTVILFGIQFWTLSDPEIVNVGNE